MAKTVIAGGALSVFEEACLATPSAVARIDMTVMMRVMSDPRKVTSQKQRREVGAEEGGADDR